MPLPASSEKLTIGDWLAGAALFSSTAIFVFWQNLRLASLWDLSAILENAYRISQGAVPYRDFPLPFAPLTFLTQAAIIKLTGRVYFHHVIYAAAAGGLATVLAWRILGHFLKERVNSPRLAALLLAAPLIFLGVCSIFPHPFYDSDCTIAILVAILLLLRLPSPHLAPTRAFFTGAAVVVPLFAKQNAGLAFLVATLL